MSSLSATPAPPGWYPDPTGARQWRVWTGSSWSHLTREFGPPPPSAHLSSNLGLVDALDRLVRYGITGVYAGLALLVGLLAHWPHNARPTSEWFAVIGVGVAVAMLAIGSASFSFAQYELEGRWSLGAFVPGVNVIAVNTLVARRLGARPFRRVASEVLVLVIFAVQFHAQTWLCVAPVIVAVGQFQWVALLLDRIVGPATRAPGVAI